MLFMRPEQPKPVLQVPLFPVPQHGCPSAPQVPHWFPAVAIMQDSAVMQAVTVAPPSAPPSVPPGPPPVGQQGCPAPPQVAHMPGVPALLMRPVQASPVVHVPLFPVPQHG